MAFFRASNIFYSVYPRRDLPVEGATITPHLMESPQASPEDTIGKGMDPNVYPISCLTIGV